jgi:hypothetical protein
MKYRKKFSKIEIWENYCKCNPNVTKELELPTWIFIKEDNFRNFATTGKMSSSEEKSYNFSKLTDNQFWELFMFTTSYFDMDTILFTKLEKNRLSRKE